MDRHKALDGDVTNIIKTVIENDLTAPKVPKKRIPKLKRIWKCDNAHDFLYGHRVGYYKGLAEGIILERYRHQLSQEEDNDVFEIVQGHTRELRKYFAYCREVRKKVTSR